MGNSWSTPPRDNPTAHPSLGVPIQDEEVERIVFFVGHRDEITIVFQRGSDLSLEGFAFFSAVATKTCVMPFNGFSQDIDGGLINGKDQCRISFTVPANAILSPVGQYLQLDDRIKAIRQAIRSILKNDIPPPSHPVQTL